MKSRTNEPGPAGAVGVAFLVAGRVQGVGFRWWVRGRAHHLGIRGSVRNRDDGAVEVRAYGSPEAIATLREELQRGPPAAVVASVSEDPLPAPAPPGPFEIAG